MARDASPDVLEHVRIVLRRKWVVLAIALLAAVAATGLVLKMTPIYRATATILIEQGKSKVVSIEEALRRHKRRPGAPDYAGRHSREPQRR